VEVIFVDQEFSSRQFAYNSYQLQSAAEIIVNHWTLI